MYPCILGNWVRVPFTPQGAGQVSSLSGLGCLLWYLQVIMTFTLISVVYACGIAKPGHGSMTPLAVGLSLVACAGAGGKYTGEHATYKHPFGSWLTLNPEPQSTDRSCMGVHTCK